MNRSRAALVHFGLSLLVVGPVFLIVYFLWYPEPLFGGAGGRDLFVTLALVDITIGPLITLIIFKPGKKGLKFDLATIAVLQVAALAYGTHIVYEARPVWIVFLKDRFDLVRANQIQEHEHAKAQFRELSLSGPKLAGARIPKDPDDQFRTMISALAGLDVSSYPRFYVPYAEIRGEVAAKARPMAELRRHNAGSEADVDRLVAGTGRKEAEIAYLPVRAGKKDLAMVVDAKTGETLKLTHLKPWSY